MRILLTGGAGFIGYHVSRTLASSRHEILILDSVNEYYDINLKFARLAELGIKIDALLPESMVRSRQYEALSFKRTNLCDSRALQDVFLQFVPDVVCHLAAQPGVRASIYHPELYLENNVIAFYNLLECCRNANLKHFVYASSSSVYGNSSVAPFAVDQATDHPESFYAATKKTNEIFASCYSRLYGIPMTGLRFFTVYGPWGRPDMALFKFTKAIDTGGTIELYNEGKMLRDFTYVEDVAHGVARIIDQGFCYKKDNEFHNIYNLGGEHPVELLSFIKILEKLMNKKAVLILKPMQPGDVLQTWADGSELRKDYGIETKTALQVGMKNFVEWFRRYYEERK